jgi:hypothetical protein
MRAVLVTLCVFIACILPCSGKASACINDSGTLKTESEFKRHYEFKSGYQEPRNVSPVPENSWGPVAATGSGVGLLLAALGLVTVNVRRSLRA